MIRFCFLEIGKEMRALSPPEYAVLAEWYDYLETNLDIGLDLIGINSKQNLIAPILI